eukprot:1697493-Amphidinium_carterae.1
MEQSIYSQTQVKCLPEKGRPRLLALSCPAIADAAVVVCRPNTYMSRRSLQVSYQAPRNPLQRFGFGIPGRS